ncbi:MAG: hypothetical protein ED559_01695 [Phycisphaera sp.]|nr:MAG: hypothetical protein ED559_01695 [Phycisphaera sp.]
MLRVHRRQFVIGPSSFVTYEGWRSAELGSVVFSYDRDLRVQFETDRNGIRWAFVGIGAPVVPEHAQIAEQIRASGSGELEKAKHDWTGRWVLVSERTLLLDAGGYLGCHFGQDNASRWWASSSPALLSQITGRPYRDGKLAYQQGMSWYPPPMSCIERAHRLLPSQALDPKTGEVRPVRLVPDITPGRDESSILEELSEVLPQACKGLAEFGEPFWVGLSAGIDSRVVLAAAVNSGIEVKAFTWLADRTPIADRILPAQLCELAGIEHKYIETGPVIEGRRELFREHTGDALSEGDALPFLRGVRESLAGLCTGGQAFDISKAGRRGTFLDSTENPRLAAESMCRVFLESKRSVAADGFTRWLEWVNQHPEEHMDWRDRYQSEQRTAGWQSDKEQLYDTHTLERFAIINSGRINALLLSLSEESRLEFGYLTDLVRMMCPKLAELPTNPDPRTLIGRLGVLKHMLARPGQVLKRIRHKADRITRRARLLFD